MSRVFTGTGDFLSAAGALTEDSTDVTFFAWIKEDWTDRGLYDARYYVALGEVGIGNGSQYLSARGDGGDFKVYQANGGGGLDANASATNNAWVFVAVRRSENGADPVTYSIHVYDGATSWTNSFEDTRVGLENGKDDIFLGRRPADTDESGDGKIAHAGVFLRALTDSEIDSLGAGTNPGSLDPAGRYAYYPMDTDSLVNEWNGDSGVGSLSVTGVVANDDADNPTVSAAVVPASLTVTPADLPLVPGGTISGTYADYETIPTTLTVSDGTNTITIPTPTITDNGDGTGSFSGTMPALPTTDTADLVLFGDVTVELS